MAMNSNFFLLGITIYCMVLKFGFIKAAPRGSLITSIPGFSANFPSKHYSGYVSFDKKNLFYYFVVSERNPSKDPVVLWLNGGPGCSSFDGFVYEHGPFNFEEGKPKGSLPKLHLNPYSWSKVSNIIYLDSPCGVGLSYSNDTSKYTNSDFGTAADSHTFLLKWFELYPEFVSNPFYISGESYAGVYVPMLASQVAQGIKYGQKPILNFKGYLVGNGATDNKFDGANALIPFAHGMGLISNDIFEEIQNTCKGNYINRTSYCDSSLDKLERCLTGLNIYDILEACYHDLGSQQSKTNSSLPESFKQLGFSEKPLQVRNRMFGRAWPLWKLEKDGKFPMWHELALQGNVPCFNDKIATTWLNDESVRKALHAEPKSIAGPWELCSSRIAYEFGADSMVPYHKNLTTQGYRALIYSGDHDMCVPFTGSQAWTRSLGYKIVDEWRPWISMGQVAGYLQGYDKNLIFLTIKGAGHTVPEYKPHEALDFYTRWLDGKSI
ncbi:serine carboxypeptidase 1-like [Mercurialis annua]|uniref:serine carboxypeptidase 1-like n=1 Tax=Mercurialis annua TaxID=3986 RepID=UPI00215E0291|nr:serine carboxypeptidase 1-like [Mercurialis annua]